MNLSFKDLKKREVVNLRDGKSLGHIVDLVIRFPQGTLAGIVVPANNGGFFSKLFSRQTIYVSEKQIMRIGGDVIFVDLRCGDLCEGTSTVIERRPPRPPKTPPCGTPCSTPRREVSAEESIFDAVRGGEEY